jgi:transposase InsO family protein
MVCSQARVARRMQHLGLKAIQTKAFKVTTDSQHRQPVYADLLERDTTTSAINHRCRHDGFASAFDALSSFAHD